MIEVIDSTGQKMYIDPSSIVAIYKNENGYTAIALDTGDDFYTRETVDSVYNKYQKALE